MVVVMFHIGKPYNPEMSTYDTMRRMGIPVVLYWYDIAHPFVHQGGGIAVAVHACECDHRAGESADGVPG